MVELKQTYYQLPITLQICEPNGTLVVYVLFLLFEIELVLCLNMVAVAI
jgi:hypothetical protein